MYCILLSVLCFPNLIIALLYNIALLYVKCETKTDPPCQYVFDNTYPTDLKRMLFPGKYLHIKEHSMKQAN